MSTNNNRTGQTKKTGRSKRGSYDKISIQKREKAVEIYQNTIGISINKIAIQARLPKSTCYNIIKRFEETGSVVTKKRGGEKKGDLDEAHIAYLTRLLDEQDITTAKDLKTKMMEGLGTTDSSGLSVSAIQRCIKAHIGFSLKRKLRYPIQRNDEEVLQKRYEFVQKLFLESIDYRHNCIFVEESGFNLWLIKGQAYSPKIDKPNVPIYRSRARNISIVAAISSNGVEYSAVNLMLSSAHGGVTTQYLKDLIRTMDEQNRPPQTFVMDEFSLINALEVKEVHAFTCNLLQIDTNLNV
jgi:transposase